ncbi:centrosomal protein of 83 kDa-like [Lineus longissimus]|uniref:centrosomal protein of 83 kDa-like n=1 Tax=Lineus longissimus TaxID=88925 RepID=UPI002B4E7AF6
MASMYPTGKRLGQSMPTLATETETQKMLADEKMRSEQHRTNYQTLKAEHTRLQDEYTQMQNEHRNTIEESKLMQEKYKSLIEQGKRENADLIAQVDDLKTQVVTPQRLDIMRMQIADELERVYKERFGTLEAETERYRSEYNKLRYEYSFLKSEYEHDKVEQQRILDEMKLQHEAEVTNLRKEREATIARQLSEVSHDTQKVRQLQRDNAQLHLKVKGLLSELEEIRAQREHLGMQSDHVSRIQTKQLTEHASNIRALQTERDSLRAQLDSVTRELTNYSDENNRLTSRVHELEKENIVLRNRVDELSHRGKVDMTNLRMEMMKSNGELERERDKLQSEVEDLQSQLEIAKHTLQQQSNSLVEKERDCVKKIQVAREEEWSKMTKIENEKLELETKLQEVERRRIDEEGRLHQEREKMNEQIRAAEDARETAEKETLVFRTKFQQHQSVLNQLEQERSENSDLKARIHRIENELTAFVTSEREILEENSHLRSQNDMLDNELKRTHGDLNRDKEGCEKLLAQHRAMWIDEKTQLHGRLAELDEQLAATNKKLNQATVVHKKRKRRYQKYARALKDKCELLKAKCEKLSLEKGALKNSVSSDAYSKVRRQLKDLTRRHTEFRNIMMMGTNYKDVLIGQSELLMPISNDFEEQEKQHQRDLQVVRQRLETLDNKQQEQMDEMSRLNATTTYPESQVETDEC